MPSSKYAKHCKVVLDTNNLISAQINTKGPSHQVFKLFLQFQIRLYSSPFQIKELQKVLNYRRIKSKFALSHLKINKIIKKIKQNAILIYPRQTPKFIKQDRDDDHIVAIAIEGKVDVIISGDEHLLKHKSIQGIPVLTVQQFLTHFKS